MTNSKSRRKNTVEEANEPVENIAKKNTIGFLIKTLAHVTFLMREGVGISKVDHERTKPKDIVDNTDSQAETVGKSVIETANENDRNTNCQEYNDVHHVCIFFVRNKTLIEGLSLSVESSCQSE